MSILENKIFYSNQLSNEEYHADPAIGSSGIKAFKECPAIYHAKYLAENKQRFSESAAQRIGSFAHVRLLEPEKFKAQFDVSPEFALVNKGKSNEASKPMTRQHGDWKDFEATTSAVGKQPILFSEMQQVMEMAHEIKVHPIASKMLLNGQEEMSFFAKDTITGLMMKSRPDYLVKLPDYGIILIDYKTTGVPLSIMSQSNHAFRMGRHIQAAHHKRVAELATGGKIDEVVYITQMQEPPYLIRIFRMPPEAILVGDDMCRLYLDRMAECFRDNEWPTYPPEIEDYTQPQWLNNDFD